MMPQAAGGLPSLELELETRAQLEDAWSGPVSPQPWRGQLGDGEAFAVEWGIAGDLRFTYGERACFRLDPAGSRLGCAPATAGELDWQRVLITRVLPNVSLARGREALHASAVDTPLGVVAIAARSGIGKSTLARELIGRGWPLFADDTVVLAQSGDSLLAHPASPHINLPASGAAAEGAEALGSRLGDLAGERWIAVRNVCEDPRQLAAVVILERESGRRLEAKPLDPTPLTLAPYMLGLPDEASERAAARFGLYSDLVVSVPLWRLSGDVTDTAEDLAGTLESTFGLQPQAVAGGTA